MLEQTQKPIDKSKWADGPWKTEPDRLEWKHLGFPCLIVRVRTHGALCGYVAVPPGHLWHGQDMDDIQARVHGGLTYADSCSGNVCHVPAPGEPDDVHWVGFDNAHGGDFCPGDKLNHCKSVAFPSPFSYDDGSFSDRGTYRDINYVKEQVESLAQQAKDAPARGVSS